MVRGGAIQLSWRHHVLESTAWAGENSIERWLVLGNRKEDVRSTLVGEASYT